MDKKFSKKLLSKSDLLSLLQDQFVFSNDYVFGKVLENIEVSRKFVEVLLGRKIKEITAPEIQKTKKPLRVSKGVRFDVYFEGEAELINIECQVGNYGDITKRARYYKSILNVDSLEKGEKYDKLKNVYVLFICLDDPLNYGLPIYTCETMIKEINKPVGDGEQVIFYNCAAADKVKDRDIRALLKFMKTNEATSELTEEIKNMTKLVRQKNESLFDFYNRKLFVWDAYDEGVEVGREKGKIEGLKEGRNEGIMNLAENLRAMGVSADIINKATELSLGKAQ